jgi:protease-4
VGLLLVVLACGCARRPLHAVTSSQIHVTGPVSASVTTHTDARRDSGPLVETTVVGCARRAAAPKIAMIDIDGILVNANLVGPYSMGENPVALLHEKLSTVAADPEVRAVVLRINSPGGGVTASDMMWHGLHRFRAQTGLPMVAFLLELGTGGAYYLATAADQIYAHPTTVTGGIGVVLNLYNLRDTMAMANITSQTIKAGENIDLGTSLRELTPEGRQWLQSMADEYHERFKRLVRGRRPLVADDPTLYDGRVFTAEQAKARGLIDEVGYLDDAIAAACRQAGVGEARVVMYHRASDVSRTPYGITPNNPPQGRWLPVSLPGLDRSRLPMFLYIWALDPTLDKSAGQ